MSVFSYSVFLQGTIPAMKLGGKKNLFSGTTDALGQSWKGCGGSLSVEEGKSLLNSLVFRSQYKHIATGSS